MTQHEDAAARAIGHPSLVAPRAFEPVTLFDDADVPVVVRRPEPPPPRSLQAKAPAHPKLPSGPAEAPQRVEVRRSARRRRTVSAYRDGDRTIVLVPARMSRADERRWVDVMLGRLQAKEQRRDRLSQAGDAELHERAMTLSRRWLDGAAVPVSVRWTDRQNTRWGSCTPTDRTIRLSDRLRPMPTWVVDYVLVHELAHLLHVDHGPAFQELVARYPRAERARGYLEGVVAGVGGGAPPTGECD